MIDGGPDVNADNGRAGGVGDGGLGPDGALEEGQQDVRDGLDGAEDQGVAATIDSRVEGKGTGLALREVGWADASCGGFFQEVVTVISAGEGIDRDQLALLKLTRIQF